MGPRFNGVEDKIIERPGVITADASMGPRFNGVEDCRSHRSLSPPNRLQWGHALMAWKTAAREHVEDSVRSASMGPRFNGVEDHPAVRALAQHERASMGPRFNGVEDCAE